MKSISFDTIPSRRAFEEVCSRIRAEVAKGSLRVGDKLPPERELAQQFGVSRLAIREALRSLENAGMLALRRGPKGGAFIRGGGEEQLTVLMLDMLHLGKVPLSDLTEARIFILDSVARLACRRATQDDLAALQQNVDINERLLESENRQARLASATEFYKFLAEATKNKVMMLVVSSLTETLAIAISTIEVYPSRDLARSRRRLLQHLRNRDPDAAAAEISSHLRNLHEHLATNAVPRRMIPPKIVSQEDECDRGSFEQPSRPSEVPT